MKTSSVGKVVRLFFILHFSFFISSCSDEDKILVETGKQEEVYLRVQVPGHSAPVSRALTALDESRIQTLDVLVFKEGVTEENYLYRRAATSIEGNSDGSTSIRTFAISLQASESGEKYRFVLLANLRSEIESATLTVGDDKETTLQKITFAVTTAWDSSTPRCLPMWGESQATHEVTPSLSATDIGTIYLIRSVARLDVGVNMDGADDAPQGLTTGDTFQIEEVRIYNTSNSGYAAPGSNHFNSTGGESGKGITTAPSIPASSSPVLISHTHNRSTTPNGFHREIYLAETAATENHTLLIAGYYTPQGQSQTNQKTWYRVNLYDQSVGATSGTLADILRNHRYRVNIIGVNRAGYLTDTEALAAEPENLKVEFTIYDEGGELNHTAYNGQYKLSASTDYVLISDDGVTNCEIVVNTNVPTPGWNYSFTDSPEPGEGNPLSWITYTSGSYTGVNQKDKLTFEVPGSLKSKTRTGYLHLTAGTLTLTVKIEQERGIDPNCYILMPGGSLEFPVRNAYKIWENEIMGYEKQTLTGPVTCGIIWQDVENLVTVEINPNGDQGEKTKLKVTARGTESGNAVVGVYVDGTLRYSWHIWVTDYNPDTNTNGKTYLQNNGYRDYLFMDRNLGATTATPGDATTLGLLYQWGRKDPFIGVESISNPTVKTIYGLQIEVQETPETLADINSNNLHNTFLYPYRRYWKAELDHRDWFTTHKDYQNHYLWNDESNDKGVFDPCPDGWRVPIFTQTEKYSYSPWYNLNTNNFIWNSINMGRTYNGNFYPGAGWYDTWGGFRGLGSGYYWTATNSGNSAYYMIFSHIAVTHTQQYRIMCFSVRCVQD